MYGDLEWCRRAVRSKNARFDGWFFAAMITTGNYCRPSCPAMRSTVENMRFYPSSAAAQQAGFRACKRCRPDASPGSPQWNERADLVARAMRLIADGVVDRYGVPGLASRLGYSVRQVQRQLKTELGAGPLAIARAQRAQTARMLIESSSVPMGDVAFAAGFSSVRSFNDTVRDVFGLIPSELRKHARSTGLTTAAPGCLTVRMPFRAPLCSTSLFGQLSANAIPGIEVWRDGTYSRTIRLPHGHAVAKFYPVSDEAHHIECQLHLADLRDLSTAITRCRRMLDLDADPVAVDDLLSTDPLLAPVIRSAPGKRVAQTVDPVESIVRAILGQQASTLAARQRTARYVAAHGEQIHSPIPGLTHLFPDVTAIAPSDVAVPKDLRRPLATVLTALANGDIDVSVGCDREEARSRLSTMDGVESRTIEVISMRALGDPDAFVAPQQGIEFAATRLYLQPTAEALTAYAYGWRPWRSYAAQYLREAAL